MADAAPLHRGSDGGKCIPDVAGRARAENRVGHRVQRHVGVGVAGQADLPRQLHAAQPHGTPGRERVHVDPLADPYPPGQHGGQQLQILPAASP